uniref:NADH dehydrogenase [ubiquinone] 1 beta subcomplex subunit 5, mitochondrial n=1 Tax=Rhabditophanes sp. KR3021 TaxID=114890 RepID=A0AC35UBN7_9BILA
MTVLSKAGLSAFPLIRRQLAGLKPNQIQDLAVRCSHAHLFVRRPGQLITNRIKDAIHFYFVGIGLLPVLMIVAYNHIKNGNCELRDIPEGETPHYWQYERTPIRQWWSKHFGISDMEHHERNLAYFERQQTLALWRRQEQRVRHLEGERWDYKAWSYQPVSAKWVDYGRWQALRLKNQYEQHAHYAQ